VTTVVARAQVPLVSIEELLLAGRFAAAQGHVSVVGPLACGPGRPPPRACAAWVRLAALDWSGPRTRDLPPTPAGSLPPDAVELFERGWLAARAAWPGGDADLLTIAHAAADAFEARGGLEAERYQALLLSAIGAAQEERDVMALALTQAADLEMRLRMAAIELPPFFAFDRVAGDLWLQVHRFEQARLHYRAALARDARDARAWLGLARAATRLGDREEAIRAAGTFLTMWTGADTDRPELAAARAILAAVQPTP
jgi:tetratricopeptide (TPR) repeat protein